MSAIERCIAGIDPGQSGAIAFFFPSQPDRIAVENLPVAGKEINAAELARMLRQWSPTLAVVEQASSRPGQGIVSGFRFGQTFGAIKAVVSVVGIPTYLVSPGRWKKFYRLSGDKELSRALAIRLWPTATHFRRKLDHNRAEAALIARFGAETLR